MVVVLMIKCSLGKTLFLETRFFVSQSQLLRVTLAFVLQKQSKQAENWFEEALQIHEKVYGTDHRRSLKSRAKLLANQVRPL